MVDKGNLIGIAVIAVMVLTNTATAVMWEGYDWGGADVGNDLWVDGDTGNLIIQANGTRWGEANWGQAARSSGSQTTYFMEITFIDPYVDDTYEPRIEMNMQSNDGGVGGDWGWLRVGGGAGEDVYNFSYYDYGASAGTTTLTSIARSNGEHRFAIGIENKVVSYFIDGARVGSTEGNPHGFDPGGVDWIYCLAGRGASSDDTFTAVAYREMALPEPGTMALLGLGALALLRRRR